MITERETRRYARQIAIPGWGSQGQERLREAKVLVAGVGGLGSSVATYLAVAGVGKIRIVDCDRVEPSNLNRQVLHWDRDVGRHKIDSAVEKLASINPDIHIEGIKDTIREDNVSDLVADHLIVDAMDNLAGRYLLNLAAIGGGLPLFHGAVYGFEGRVTTVIPGTTPCLRCLYRGDLPGEVPVVGVAPGIVGCIQAAEVIKHVLGLGRLLAGRLLVFDGLSLSFSELRVKKDPECEHCKSFDHSVPRGEE